MASKTSVSETTPLIQAQQPQPSSSADTPKKGARNVTFNPNPAIIAIDGSTTSTSQPDQSSSNVLPQHFSPSQSGQPKLMALNSKMRRRNSYGAPLTHNNTPKIGPQRTTK